VGVKRGQSDIARGCHRFQELDGRIPERLIGKSDYEREEDRDGKHGKKATLGEEEIGESTFPCTRRECKRVGRQKGM